jgi:hypothetical protein
MKVTHEKVEGFRPFALNIVVESEEEAGALYAIFSYTPNAKRLPNGSCELREAIRECVGGRPDYDDALTAICQEAVKM